MATALHLLEAESIIEWNKIRQNMTKYFFVIKKKKH